MKVETGGPELLEKKPPFDVAIIDGVQVKRLPPGRYLFVNTVPEGVPLEVQGKVQDPPIVDWDRTHPAMRYLDLSKVAIQEAMRVRPLGGGRALVESNLTPLIYAMDEGGVKAIFLGFDLYRTDLPLRVAFPLFVSNALRWLSPSRLEDAGLQLRAGQTLAAALPAGAGTATLTDPAGRKHALQADADGRVSYVDTTSAGIYTVTADGWEQRFVVNLLDDAESNVGVHAQGVAGRAEARRAEDASALFPSRQDLWKICALAALALLLLRGGPLPSRSPRTLAVGGRRVSPGGAALHRRGPAGLWPPPLDGCPDRAIRAGRVGQRVARKPRAHPPVRGGGDQGAPAPRTATGSSPSAQAPYWRPPSAANRFPPSRRRRATGAGPISARR